MTNKAIQKLLIMNCAKITDLVGQMYDALDEFDDDELTDITTEWLNMVDQCVNVEVDDVNSSLYSSIDYLNSLEE